MPEYILPSELNQSGGIETLFNVISVNVPNFMAVFFVFIFFLIVASGYSFQQRTRGRANASQWFAIASFIVTVLAIMMSLVPTDPPLFSIEYVVVAISVSVISMLWFFYDSITEDS